MRVAALFLFALLLTMAAAARADEPTVTPQDLLQDIRTFETQVVDRDRAYMPAARSRAKARLRVLDAKAPTLSPLEIAIEICRIAALADNGHTGCQSLPIARPVEISFYPLNGGVYVFAAAADQTDLLGGRLVAIDGRPIKTVRRVVRTLFGGRPDWRDLNTVYAYSRPAVMHALGLTREAGAATYRIRTPGGRIVERRLQASLADVSMTGLMSPERTPWSWRDLGIRLRWRDAPEHGAIVVQLRGNLDQPGHPIGGFLAEVERQRAALGRKTVILDLRSNGGGDLTLTNEFLAAWPGRIGPGGRFIVLLGPRTFSAGIADAAYLKQAGGRQVTLIGASTGDGLTFYAEGANVRLPAVQLTVRPATERDDFRDGCRPYADCHAALAQPGGPTATPADRAAHIKRMPVAVASLDPDIAAPTAIGDYLAGRDSGLAAALDLARPCTRAAEVSVCREEKRDLAGPTR